MGRAAASSVRVRWRRGPVSAVSASPAAQGSPVAGDPVRALQHALYRAAKADPGRRFHALYDKVSRSDVLWRAWVAVRRNNGAPGIDKITLAQVEEYGIGRLLGELASELREGRYRAAAARAGSAAAGISPGLSCAQQSRRWHRDIGHGVLRVRKLVVACRWKSGPGSCQEAR